MNPSQRRRHAGTDKKRWKARSKIRLSICIPTFDFGTFIGETLDSILSNMKDGVELLVLDGGSTDDTPSEVERRQAEFPALLYYRQKERGGIDRDIAKAVELARGEYCWLFSADDVMKPGAVEKVLRELDSGEDVYLCEHILCDFHLRPLMPYSIFSDITLPETFHLGKEEDRLRYFTQARTSEAFFSFLSGPIFKRTLWNEGEGIAPSFYETGWGIAGRLLSLAKKGFSIRYLAESLLYKRGENDSFLEHGSVNRLRMSVEGFAHVGETIFGKESAEAYHMRRVVRNEWTLRVILTVKLIASEHPETENVDVFRRVVARHYLADGPANALKYAVVVITPAWTIRWMKALNTALKSRRME